VVPKPPGYYDKTKGHAIFPLFFVTVSVMAEGSEAIKNITNSGFIGKPINTRTFVKDSSQFIK
jgi:two-component system cell cycle response regulator DivK